MNPENNEPAFPHLLTECQTRESEHYRGLSKRELFAALAMQGILAAGSEHRVTTANAVDWAVQHADALLAALEVEK